MFAALAASITLTIWPHGAFLSARTASFRFGFFAARSLSCSARLSIVTGSASGPRRTTPFASMVTTSGGFSFAPGLSACVDSGSTRCSGGACLKVVVTSRKITSTISTSISATMMTAGAVRRLRMRNLIACSFLVAVLAADEFVAERFHLHGEHLDLFAEITPRHQRRNGDEQADQGRLQNQADALRKLGGVVEAGCADVVEHRHHADDGADQPQQRRDADDDFEDDEAAFEPDDFPARSGFQR